MILGLYFLIGVVQDFLIAKYYLALSRHSVWLASILAMVITYGTMKVFNLTFGSDSLFLAYALGTGAGTFLGCRKRRVKHGTRRI
jgi:hypothetical protein